MKHLPREGCESVPARTSSSGDTTLSRRTLLKAMGISAGATLLGSPLALAARRPDILMVVLDDMGFSDLGAFGAEIHTPHMDALAFAGLRYNRFDTCAVCSSSRATLLTGRNNHTVNMAVLPPAKGSKAPPADIPLGAGPATSGEIPLNAHNIAQTLQASGYATYALGKWHLAPEYDDAPQRNQAFWPLQRGFGQFHGFISGHTDQYHPRLIDGNDAVGQSQDPAYHLSADLVDRAIEQFTTPTARPKFLYLAFGAAHSPLQVPPRFIERYKGRYDQGWDQLRAERFARQKALGIIPADTTLAARENGDEAWAQLDDQQKRVYSRFMETYAGFITHTDEQIGRLIDALKASGQYDNTLIVLISDNGVAAEGGPHGGFHRAYFDQTPVAQMDQELDQAGGPSTDMLYQRPWAYASCTPFRRYKLWPNLGGVRTPLIVTWPTVIRDPGAIRSQYVHAVDIAPMLAEAAGTHFATSIEGVAQISQAGQSFLKTLTSPAAVTHDTQYFELKSQRAITHGRWRAVGMHRPGTDPAQDYWELYDIEHDFAEARDLARQQPHLLEQLKRLWWDQARRYSDTPMVEPDPMIYDYLRMGDGMPRHG
ncbi:arylsulfatase [Enterobacterales bacterium AW_CKDN230030176-1A_HGKHYDSX7]